MWKRHRVDLQGLVARVAPPWQAETGNEGEQEVENWTTRTFLNASPPSPLAIIILCEILIDSRGSLIPSFLCRPLNPTKFHLNTHLCN